MSVKLMSMVFESTLSPTKKLVMLSLADHANDDGRSIYPSVARLCRNTSLGERSVRRILSQLRKQRVIIIAKSSTRHAPTEYEINIKTIRQIRRPATVAGLVRPATESVRPATESVRPATVAPDPSVIHHDPSRGESTPTAKAAKPAPLIAELEREFAINLDGDAPMVERALARYAPQAGHGEKFAAWWQAHDFRGQRGEAPTARQIIQLWPQAFKQRGNLDKLKGVRHD